MGIGERVHRMTIALNALLLAAALTAAASTAVALDDCFVDLGKAAPAGSGPILLRTVLTFAPGELASADDVVVYGGGGGPVPADPLPTLKWADGSVRVLALRSALPGRRACRRIRIRIASGRKRLPPGIVCRKENGVVTVETGPLTAVMNGRAQGFLTAIRYQSSEIEELGEGLNLDVKFDGRTLTTGPGCVSIEKGRARTRIRFSGVMRGAESSAGPGYDLILSFTAGSAAIGLRIDLAGGPMTGFCEGADLKLRPPWRSSNAPVRVHAGGLVSAPAPAAGGTVRLRARPSRVELACGDETEYLAKESDARVVIVGAAPDTTLVLPDFGRMHPWGVTVVPGGTVAISLLNEGFDWEPFFAFRRDLTLSLGDAAATELFKLPAPSRRSFMPGAPGGIDPECDPLAALFLEVTAGLLRRLAREWKRWDGFMNYGDYRKSHGIWANQEYDPAFGMLRRYLMTGSDRDLGMARRALDHWLCYDRAGTDDPFAMEGTPWMHGADHRSCRTEPGHMWLESLLLYALMTGESEYRDAAVAVGRCLAKELPRLAKTRLERSLSWALLGFVALVEAGHGGFREAMDRTAAILRSRQAECGLIALRGGRVEDVPCLVANTWVTGGITVEALYRHYRLTDDMRSLESAVGAARAVLERGHDPESGRYFQLIYFDRGSGEVLDRRGRVEKGRAVLLSLAAARAYRMTGDERFRLRARSLLERGLNGLRAGMPEFPGEDAAMVLRAGPDVLADTR